MPQNRQRTGFRGPHPNVGKATQFKPGNRANPGGRPKKTKLTDAMRAWLEETDKKTGLTNAEIVAAAQGKRARKGDTKAFVAIGDRVEGKPSQSVNLTGEIALRGSLVDRTVRPPRKTDAST